MKRALIFALYCVAIITNLHAQQLKVIIVNKKGEPISNSTVYIYETAKGIAADNRGEFQTTLEPGTYTCEFRSLGYESLKKTISMSAENQSIRIELPETSYALKEVVVYANHEDPAYRIMRKAIAHAPYYRYQVKEYTSEAYIKGSLTIDKIPGIFKRAMKVNDKGFDINSLIGKPLLMESHSNIHFISPETYTQNVIALKSSIPKEFNVNKGLSITTSSIYDPKFDGRISPLANGAFRFYSFKLENVDYKPDYIVNKIKVIPRKKNPDLFSGYIYILENTWNVYIADLTVSELGTKLHYRINFHQVKPSVYLPTTYDVSMQMNTMGVKGAGKYYASMKYNSVEIDESRKPSAITSQNTVTESIDKKTSPKQQKILAEIEKLSKKEQLSTKEAYKMSKLMSRVTEPEEVKKQRESLEIKDIEQVKMEVDTLAWKKDSVYWNAIRELPLREDEARSYQVKDSISAMDSTEINPDNNSVSVSIDSNPKTVFGKITQGGRWKINDKMSLRYGGLFGVLKDYNFVDGFWLGQSLSYNLKINKNANFSFSPSAYYTTTRKDILWHVSTSFDYAPMRLGQFYASAGHISRDVNEQNGESRFANAISAISLGQNFIRFYDSRFVRVSNDIDIANGLRLFTDFEINKRNILNNTTSFNFRNKPVAENIPSLTDGYRPHTASTVKLSLSYTPFYRYRVREGKKSYDSSKYPTFEFGCKYGVNRFMTNNQSTNYHRFAAAVHQNINLSPFESLSYSFSGGRFFSKNTLEINDFKYINNSPMIFTTRNFSNSFNLLSPYTASQKWWMEGHLNFRSAYLFIKNLPFLQGFLFDESVHLHALSTENLPLYIEGGYSIGFSEVGRVGVFTGFSERKFDRIGIRVSYPLFKLFERPLK